MRRNIIIVLIMATIVSCVGCANRIGTVSGTTHEIENPTDTPMTGESITDEKTEISDATDTSKITETSAIPETSEIPNTDENIEDQEPVVEDKSFSIKLTFTGDMMLASYKNQTTSGSFNEYSDEKDPSYFLEKVRAYFEEDDFTIVNLENVFTNQNLKEVEKDHDPAYWYRSRTSNVDILTCSSVEGVSLANNHTNDYGSEGRNDTIETVKNAGLQYGLESKIMYFEKNGFTVAVICNGLWGEWQADSIIKLIKKAEENSDYQIVFYHGGKERLHEPEEWKVRASRKLVDNGADLVIGNHPHVLQPREVYNGAEIIYSMGNFCYGGSRSPENRTIIYRMELKINENLEVEESISTIIPCYVYTDTKNNYQPAPVDDEKIKNKILDFMDGKLDTPV